MSYILNALKKAERDRKREEIEDLDDFVSADWDPYKEPTESRASYKIAVSLLRLRVQQQTRQAHGVRARQRVHEAEETVCRPEEKVDSSRGCA